jgi:methanogenic corrinoid protein MtbC1
MTGIGIDTLRAWERRHRAVAPTRDQRGRLYSEADLERLRLLRDVVLAGHPIGRIAPLDDATLRRMAGTAADRAVRERVTGPPAPPDVDDIVDALTRFDVAGVEARLARAATLRRPITLLREVVVPALQTVGDRWHAGELGAAHEHLLSSLVRDLLGSLMRIHWRGDVPDRLIFATLSGERHEFGALGAAVIAASGGLGTIYLGPDLPSADLIDIVSVVDADVVALGVTATGEAGHEMAREIERVATAISRDTELWLGGPAAASIAASVRARALVVPEYGALEHELQRLGGRF